MKTLVIVSHPYPDQSHVIKPLEQIALKNPDVTVRNLESLYGSDVANFDVAAEQAASESADRIVFLFPIHWFNLTPMLKAYLNEVWAYGWCFGPEGNALKGKEMQVVTAAGAEEATYQSDTFIASTMHEVLTPMKASGLYVGMKYLEPLVLFGSLSASEAQIEAFGQQFAAKLTQ